MDIFKFTNTIEPTKLEHGELINHLTNKMWVERYLKAGEFRLVAPVRSGMKDILPTGTLISHVDTTEVMVVENHEISEDKRTDPDIVITGRSFETYLENRAVGSNVNFPLVEAVLDYSLDEALTGVQVKELIQAHILASRLIDDNNEIPYVDVYLAANGMSSTPRTLKRMSLYNAVTQLLQIDNLGIKTVRPGIWSPFYGTPTTALVIYSGEDKSSDVIFSYPSGEIESADYLWSIKELKNYAYVSGKWIQVGVGTPDSKYDRRVMYVDASDLDERYAAAPIEPYKSAIIAQMRQRGLEALMSQNDIALTKAETSKNGTKYVYRKDYNVGDFVTVFGDYNEISVMRVGEYVEIEDENGQSGYPTLTLDREI